MSGERICVPVESPSDGCKKEERLIGVLEEESPWREVQPSFSQSSRKGYADACGQDEHPIGDSERKSVSREHRSKSKLNRIPVLFERDDVVLHYKQEH